MVFNLSFPSGDILLNRAASGTFEPPFAYDPTIIDKRRKNDEELEETGAHSVMRSHSDGAAYRRMQKGKKVRLTVRDPMVCPDDGSLEEKLKIRT